MNSTVSCAIGSPASSQVFILKPNSTRQPYVSQGVHSMVGVRSGRLRIGAHMTTRKSRTQRREDLIEAARRAIVMHGTDGVLLNQVAEQAGLTSGAVLYHYPDLSDLLLEAHQAGMERFYELRVARIAD